MDRMISGTEIELSELDHLGRLSNKFDARENSHDTDAPVEFAGSRSGRLT